jgi:hypothetical protein
MAEKLEALSLWDMQTYQEQDGYDRKSMPKLTSENMKMIIDSHNNLLRVVAHLCRKLDVSPMWDVH